MHPIRTLLPRFAAALMLLALAAAPALAAWPTLSSTPGVIAGATSSAPSTVSDGAGGAIIVWTDTRNGSSNLDIYAQRYSVKGDPLWGAGVAVCSAAGNQQNPVAVADGFGGVYIVWEDSRNAASTGVDLYDVRLTSSGAVAGGWAVNGSALCLVAGDQTQPAIAVDGSANLFAVWRDLRSSATTGADIAVQKINSRGAQQWGANGTILCNATNDQTQPCVAADLAGGAYFAWWDYRSGAGADIYTRSVSSTGVSSSPVNGSLAVPRAPGEGVSLVGLCAENGVACLVYTSSNGALRDVLVTTAGPGSPAQLGPDLNLGARCSADGVNGFYVMNTYTDGAQTHLHVAHYEGQKAMDWGTDVRVTPILEYPGDYAFASDGTQGVVVAWSDARSNDYNVYAQYIDRTGRSLWTSNGVVLTSGGYLSYGPGVVADGAGGFIVGMSLGTVFSSNRFAALKRLDRYGMLGDPSPAITRVKDVPNDQGGRISLQWSASSLDAFPAQTVGDYSIWRRVPAAAAPALAARAAAAPGAPQREGTARLIALRDAASATVQYWEEIATTAARTLPGYSYTASTTSDSLPGSNPWTAFMVMAESANGTQYWMSAPDSGYSVDNLPPLPPAPAAAAYAAGATAMHWRANAETDLAAYELYRGTSASFTPSAANLVGTTADTAFTDAAGQPFVYKLAAVDVHGNRSAYTTLQPVNNVGVGDAPVVALEFAPPAPSPASAATTLRFALPAEGRVALEILDAAGRHVRTLLTGTFAAGRHAATWDLSDDRGGAVAPGLYLARLESSAGTRVQRIVRVR